jgi:hypothetical protein
MAANGLIYQHKNEEVGGGMRFSTSSIHQRCRPLRVRHRSQRESIEVLNHSVVPLTVTGAVSA